MSNINELVINEMQSLETMIDTFKQALIQSVDQIPPDSIMQDPSQFSNDMQGDMSASMIGANQSMDNNSMPQ